MCGISGFIDFNKNTDTNILNKMVQTLHHRGPDDYGTEIINNSFGIIALGHTRLSVIDITPLGHQPMRYKHLSIVFNGEIYNYGEIKRELINKGHKFVSNSDTEVILHAYEEWGINSVKKYIGMFSIVLFDQKQNEIILIRDRAGIKPLYYYWKNDLFLFGSELKAFFSHNKFEKIIDRRALSLYFDFGYVPAPFSIFENCFKIQPGEWLKLDLKTKKIKKDIYWDVNDFYRKSKLVIPYPEAKEELKKILTSAFNYRMISDVPVGVFLSGGYDSTAVVSILQNESTQKVKTFTIGFEEGFNEAPFAKETAKYFGTDHTEYYCTSKEAQEIIPLLSFYYDEPFADSSAIPTILVSRLARKDVTVALSADAGDEIFAGYDSYIKLNNSLKSLNKIPNAFKPIVSPLAALLSKVFTAKNIDIKHKAESVSKALSKDYMQQSLELFKLMRSLPDYYKNRVFNIEIPEIIKTDFNIDTKYFNSEIELAMAVDYKMYLQNDILTKVDRAAMSCSLENRDPFVDHRIIEFVAGLPLEYKFDGTITKKLLKDIVHDFIPKKMMDRPKKGFSLPIYKWLRNDLSFMIDNYLNRRALEASDLFNVDFLLHQINLFKKNKFYYTPFIWKLLMFQAWYMTWMETNEGLTFIKDNLSEEIITNIEIKI